MFGNDYTSLNVPAWEYTAALNLALAIGLGIK